MAQSWLQGKQIAAKKMYTHTMLIWILIDVQYLQNVAFNDQNHSPSDTHHPIKKIASKLLSYSLP